MTKITVRLAMVTATARMLQTTMTTTMPARQLKQKIGYFLAKYAKAKALFYSLLCQYPVTFPKLFEITDKELIKS